MNSKNHEKKIKKTQKLTNKHIYIYICYSSIQLLLFMGTMFYKVTKNTELENTGPLLLGEIES